MKKIDIKKQLEELKKKEQEERQERWRGLSIEQQQSIVQLQVSLNRLFAQYIPSNVNCSDCDSPGYKTEGTGGGLVSFIVCSSCNYVECVDNITGQIA